MVKSFRGLWRAGVHYHAGDIVARGRSSVECVSHHVAGTQSEPLSGADWARYWTPVQDFVSAAPGIALLPVAPPANLPAVVSPAPVAAAVPPAPVRASEIEDDSEGGIVNVAVALDAIRRRLAVSAGSQEQLAAALVSLERRLASLEHGSLAAHPASDDALDAVTAEAWRRKCDVLQAPSIAAARAQIDGMTREMVRLLRKRDKGGHFSPLEASRIAILDALDQHLADIDARAEVLALETPRDITADRHWPQIWGAA